MSEAGAPAALREALALDRAGRLDEAAAAYRALLAAQPRLGDVWYNLGRVLRRSADAEGALAAYAEALAVGVRDPEEVHLNRAVVYADLMRCPADAERELYAALALNPQYRPALANLANLQEDLGRRAEALALYEELLARAPADFEALARYARVKGVRGGDDPLILRLCRALDDPRADAAAQASLGFALGQLLDAAGLYEPAFAAIAAANAASRRSAPDGAPYDRAAQVRATEALIAAFPSKAADRRPAAVPAPIFICGLFRSGSTLLERALAGHPRITAGGELATLPRLVATRLAPFPESLATVGEAALAALAGDYLDALRRTFPAAEFVTDKRPDNFRYVGLIKRLFPAAKIVHTVRAPLDNCLSTYFLHLDHSMPYALDLLDTAHHLVEYRRLMAHWRTLYADDIVDVSYDRLVQDPRAELERLLGFLGLEWDAGCLATDRPEGSVRTASVWQVRQPLYRHASGRARHYAAPLAPVRGYLLEHGVEGV